MLWTAGVVSVNCCPANIQQRTPNPRDPGSALLLAASETPWPELSLLESSEMSPEVEEQSLPAQTPCSWESQGSLPCTLSILFLHRGCGVSDGAADSIPTL